MSPSTQQAGKETTVAHWKSLLNEPWRMRSCACTRRQQVARPAESTKDPKSRQTGGSLWRIFRKRIVSFFKNIFFANREFTD